MFYNKQIYEYPFFLIVVDISIRAGVLFTKKYSGLRKFHGKYDVSTTVGLQGKSHLFPFYSIFYYCLEASE